MHIIAHVVRFVQFGHAMLRRTCGQRRRVLSADIALLVFMPLVLGMWPALFLQLWPREHSPVSSQNQHEFELGRLRVVVVNAEEL